MEKHFDFIIIGAGSAGCVLANRLSSDPHVSVLLLEAGGSKRSLHQQVPAAFYKQFKTAVDWNYQTEPQQHLDGRSLYWPRGKTFGGSSAINAMIYIRGHRKDYDTWAELGNEMWGYDDVLPYFKQMENQLRGASPYHGTAGELQVADLIEPNLMSQRMVEAAVSLGYERNDDFNGARQSGFGLYQVTQKGGQRQSAADAFLRPVLKRPNLTAVPYAQAVSILMSGDTAVGINYLHQKEMKQAFASCEVILCGGAVNSPQLLMLSGIGAANHLCALDIPIRVDLPGVGQNLQDHLIVPHIHFCSQPITLDKVDNIKNKAKYFLFKKGPLTSNVAEGGGFVRTKPHLSMPNIQFHFGPAIFLAHGLVTFPGNGLSIGPTLLHPESRGQITLKSNDPFAPPAIQPNYLDAPNDLNALLEGLKIGRDIMMQPAFDAFRANEFLPGADVKSDQALCDYIRLQAETLYHPVGSCKMGRDDRAVVNEALQVYGTRNLRVVDASIMPTIVGGNTNAPVMMIAEKAAAMILA